MKYKSKQAKSILNLVHSNQSILEFAEEQQNIAATVGFDWPNHQFVLDKIQEEMLELIEAIEGKQQQHIEEEFGDLLFAMVNLGRHLKIDSEKALKGCCDKFYRRFSYIEQKFDEVSKDINNASLDEMEKLWEQAKSKEKTTPEMAHIRELIAQDNNIKPPKINLD